MEHNVYICEWSKSAAGFEFWIKERPSVRASGATYDIAMEAFLETIWKKGGAHHPVMEFVPPLPSSDFDRRFSVPEIYEISGDDSFDIDEPQRIPFEHDDERVQREAWYDDFFTRPFCRSRQRASAPRSLRPINASHITTRYESGFGILAGAWLRIFSERFLEMLTREERQPLEFRLVKRPKKVRKQY